MCDVTIWKGTKRLNKSLPEGKLLRQATAATLNISNQKNGHRQQTIHQEALGHSNCPVRALIRRVKHIQEFTNDPSTMIGTWFNYKGVGRHITGRLINNAIREAVKDLNLHENGLPEKSVGSHSLRAGGAMAMHLNGVSDNTIKKMGRWTSDTFLMYIHEQISAFTKGLSKKMSTNIDFHNVAHHCEPSKGPTLMCG